MAISLGLCPIAFSQLLAEGPHGPNGEITWAPGTPARTLGFLVLSLLCLLSALRLMVKRP
jgi:hypothetical protein